MGGAAPSGSRGREDRIWKWKLLEAPRDADSELETAALEEVLTQ